MVASPGIEPDPRDYETLHQPLIVAGKNTISEIWSEKKHSKLQPQSYQDCALPLELFSDGSADRTRSDTLDLTKVAPFLLGHGRMDPAGMIEIPPLTLRMSCSAT